MKRVVLLALLAALAGDDRANAQTNAPATYQRQRISQPGFRGRGFAAPVTARRNLAGNAVIGAGTFQRPYPYHLDYYRQKFGGSYDPYFGNLYGPPNVVLAPGFGYGGFGGFAPGGGASGGLGNQPVGQPAALCPHCGQPWPYGAVAPTGPVTPPVVTAPVVPSPVVTRPGGAR